MLISDDICSMVVEVNRASQGSKLTSCCADSGAGTKNLARKISFLVWLSLPNLKSSSSGGKSRIGTWPWNSPTP